MGFIAIIFFVGILIYGGVKGCKSNSSKGLKTYRRKSRTLSGRRWNE